MALDLPLPHQVLTHAHWTLGHEKMSKSTGNVVNPFFALDRFGADTMRYYLAYDGGIRDDADYDNDFIIGRYKKGLQGALGNLVSRVMRGKGWDVRRAVMKATSRPTPKIEEQHIEQRESIANLSDSTAILMDIPDAGEALRQIMRKINTTNAYMHHCQPWDLVTSNNSKDIAELDRIIYLCAEALRVCGILLQPYMPDKMAELLDMLGVRSDARGFDNARLGSDRDYGLPAVELGKGYAGVLFPPLRSDD
ncbi:MAG: methionyl-tRNA synthetase [Pleopsidium flavum]|nr:MAG: methionyl-tRNA synthetase [Pleopsidium flavum]